jgi:hypothetical protein
MNMVRIYRLLPGQHWGEIVPVAVLPPPPTDAELLAEARAEIERLLDANGRLMAERDAAWALNDVLNTEDWRALMDLAAKAGEGGG